MSTCFLYNQSIDATEENTWDVLRDNYMMGSKMKDWDRKDSLTEHASDIDSDSDT